MPPADTVDDSDIFSLSGSGGYSGMGGQHSPVGGCNPCLVPKLGCPCKDLLGEDRDGNEVLC